jgi:hypothetical protein
MISYVMIAMIIDSGGYWLLHPHPVHPKIMAHRAWVGFDHELAIINL